MQEYKLYIAWKKMVFSSILFDLPPQPSPPPSLPWKDMHKDKQTYFGGIFIGSCDWAIGISRIQAGSIHITMTNLRFIQHFFPALHLVVYFL